MLQEDRIKICRSWLSSSSPEPCTIAGAHAMHKTTKGLPPLSSEPNDDGACGGTVDPDRFDPCSNAAILVLTNAPLSQHG